MAKKLFINSPRKLYVLLTIFPLVVASCFVFVSIFLPKNISGSVIAQNGVADLSHIGFSHHEAVSIFGEYEFFWDKYIVTDNLTDAKPDLIIDVPSKWSEYTINNQRLPMSGKASYRVRLVNCPANVPITAYLPDVDCTYRVYLNNQLVYALVENRPEQVYTYILSDPLPRDSVLTIEILSRFSNGLYMSPILRCSESFATSSSVTAFLGAALLGMNLLALAFYVFIICTSHGATFLVWRASLTLLAMIVVFSKDIFFDFWHAYMPTDAYNYFCIITRCAIALLPYMSMNFLTALAMINFDPKIKRMYLVLGILGSLVSFQLITSGYTGLFGITLFICLLPLVHVVAKLHKHIKLGVKYSCNLASATIYLLGSLAFEVLSFSGLMQYQFVLLSPVFLTISTILVASYFARKSIGVESEKKESAQLRLSLRESEYSLMLSQIRPHFLYNALVAIEMLCTEDPESAATATRQFSEYLRSNMRSITAKDPIPFLDEMHHVESYAAIEMLRFKNRLQYSAKLEVTDFYVPPLTIQPLVENAIKHGACKNIRGGNVFVHSYETDTAYCVEIIDDGVGFDTNLPKEPEPHGLTNIETRLSYLMNARLELFSEIGKGTRAVVTIPKQNEV